MWMSEPLKTPPGQWFGVLFLSLAPVALWSFVLCFDSCCAPSCGCGRADGAGRDFLGSPMKVLPSEDLESMTLKLKAPGG